MAEMCFQVIIKADGEVRDKDGNLLSSTPVEMTAELTASQLAEMGINPQDHMNGEST